MIKQYRCKNFALYELVPESVITTRGERAWELLDSRMLITLDRLRERYGKITINDYRWGGNNHYRGLRTPDSRVFSQTSQHTFGRAADCIFKDVTPEEVRADIRDNVMDTAFEYIGGIEMDVSWFHFDVRNYSGIKWFRR